MARRLVKHESNEHFNNWIVFLFLKCFIFKLNFLFVLNLIFTKKMIEDAKTKGKKKKEKKGFMDIVT